MVHFVLDYHRFEAREPVHVFFPGQILIFKRHFRVSGNWAPDAGNGKASFKFDILVLFLGNWWLMGSCNCFRFEYLGIDENERFSLERGFYDEYCEILIYLWGCKANPLWINLCNKRLLHIIHKLPYFFVDLFYLSHILREYCRWCMDDF